ncbi:serine/threonine protein phosphatase [Frankia sp. CcI156]|uniref:Serine phosphatase n=1 Tax=Frankia casuarinae (strain DSM 45818 / CECT 9043 / HFP020203 / CcI3) TaxID=106370 RepID=Q2JCR0_FRACC|nr:PP2C family protein-serine/threonine phosphatase [Frankia casuarinae]ETA02218.1 hypothetical protein CcI6DRAFT_02393 [Frankia sp. CcI6]KFB06033.1 Stage II sporulation protein E (SpoIIE) [Frankia sp. Allo2]OFB45355.1 serine/threonine protein phosphatase [Frankia sp. CgIM4]OHV57925.1 serine/threonine protein phosphatase [Frankia sp. CgIS1]ONH28626.1 serine/threonine protein phosphatase [Frankia sp. CcI156]
MLRWFAPIAPITPMLILALVVGLQLSNQKWNVIGLAILSPMLAATFAGPRLTAGYGVAAVLAGILLGLHDDLFGRSGGGPTAQVVRLVGVTAGGVMAVLVSRYNIRRETKLQNVTRVAEVAQQTILSPVPSSSGGLRFAVRYESATVEAMIGGDLYEVVDSPWGTRLLIGDVRGKGLDAVRIASRVLSCFRLMSRRTGGLRDLLANLDAEVADASCLDDFVTAVVGQVDGSRLTLANAGHPDPVLVRAGQADLLTVSSRLPPLGLITDGSNVTDTVLRAGDRLLFYTDGITEARAPTTGAFFPLLPAAEAAFAHTSLDEALTDLADRVRDWTRSTLNDDVALLAVEVPGPTRHAGPTRRSDDH